MSMWWCGPSEALPVSVWRSTSGLFARGTRCCFRPVFPSGLSCPRDRCYCHWEAAGRGTAWRSALLSESQHGPSPDRLLGAIIANYTLLRSSGHRADPRRLTDWAASYQLEEEDLHGAFIEETGQPFVHWRAALRMRVARELLRNGEAVGVTARRLGHSHPAGSTKVFRDVHAISPREFQRGMRCDIFTGRLCRYFRGYEPHLPTLSASQGAGWVQRTSRRFRGYRYGRPLLHSAPPMSPLIAMNAQTTTPPIPATAAIAGMKASM